MSDIAIRVENLSKRYRIGQREPYRALRDVLARALTAPFRRRPSSSPATSLGQAIWALKDVSFEVKQGEVVGVIGRNGAGKTTALKILSRITKPTAGQAEIYGRVGSLLEVGTGFHPELTGRENIYLNGAILGMKKVEIDQKFDEIVAFAEVDRFIDTPVKHYSSGMYMRLAFAVAAHLEPEILLVDEVLAVGDAAFQKKCLGKMSDVAMQGRTVLFVSHNMAAILHLCHRVLLLHQGQLKYLGSAETGLKTYMGMVALPSGGQIDLASHPGRRPGCLSLLKAVRLLDANRTAKDRFLCGETMMIEFTFDPVIPLARPEVGIGVDDWMGARIFSLTTYFSESRLPPLSKPCKLVCCVEQLPLAPGRYTLSLSAGTHHNFLIDALDNAVSFDVEPGDFFGNGRIPHKALGSVLVRSRWERLEQ